MKSWILSHKILSIVLACVMAAGVTCAVVLPVSLRHKHEFSAEWTTDETYHWHECKGEKCNEVSDKAAHVFDKEIVSERYLASAATYTDAAKYYKSCFCGVKGTETFANGSSLSAKENVVGLKEGVTLGKVYDGEACALDAEEITRNGDGEVTVTYRRKDGADFENTAPKNVGEYTVKVSVAATAEWKEAEKTFDFAITAKPLTATASKVYDGTNTIADIIPEGVCEGEEVKVIVFMSNKNAGSIVTSLLLEGKDKDNYQIDQANVAASITPRTVTVEWEKEYDNSNIFTGEPVGMLEGDDVTVTVTMQSANVGAAVQSFELTGKDAGNYSLAAEDVTAEIVKADIEFKISNASAFTEFFVGATNIPDPETNYVEIGDGYGEKTIVWEKRLEGGVWSRTLTKEEVRNGKTGTYQVCVQYAEGTNYRSAVTDYVGFTVNVKPRTLAVKNFTGKTYDGTPVANFTYAALEDLVEITDISGVSDITSPYDGEKYLEFRKKGEEIYTKITSTNIPKNAAEYEYRIGITATEEWEAAVSEVKTFTIAQVEIKLEKGYVATSAILQNGDLLYLATHSSVAGEKVALRLVNGKAGLELNDTNSNYVKSNQKKQVSVQNNLDCFKLVAISTAKVSNYKIVKDPKLTSVEITVAPSEKGISSQIQEVWNGSESQKWIDTSVRSGYFMVGQTVIAYDSTGTKLFEAKIVKVHVGIGMSSKLSPSGCVIPSDGMVRIDIDITGVTYTSAKGGYLRVK